MINELSAREQKEIRCYGCTVAQMREAVEQSLTFRFSGAAMMAMSLMSDAQEQISDEYGEVDWMRREDARQTLNRAKWILSTYCMDNEVAA
jgi:hypothetical protein